jgi:hypothetical protein
MGTDARAPFWVVTLGLGCSILSGCGAPKPPPFAEKVQGTLMVGKTPLANVRVQFVPQDTSKGQLTISSATTDEKGFFSLTRDDNGKPGAVLGKHKVILIAGRPPGSGSRDDDAGSRAIAAVAPIPPYYSNVSLTPLEVEVKAGQTDYPLSVDLAVEGR